MGTYLSDTQQFFVTGIMYFTNYNNQQKQKVLLYNKDDSKKPSCDTTYFNQ